MRNILKVLVIFEMVLLFSPIVGVIFIGYKYINKPFEMFQSGENIYLGIEYLVILLFATLGIIGVVSVLIKITFQNSKVLSPKYTLIFLGLALLTIMYSLYWFNVNEIRWELVVGISVLPLLGIFHVLYLGRNYLFVKAANKSSKSAPKDGEI